MHNLTLFRHLVNYKIEKALKEKIKFKRYKTGVHNLYDEVDNLLCIVFKTLNIG